MEARRLVTAYFTGRPLTLGRHAGHQTVTAACSTQGMVMSQQHTGNGDVTAAHREW